MSEHPNVRTVNAMTEAVFAQDRERLGTLFSEDMTFHMRGPFMAGDYDGVDGLLEVLGTVFERTNGDIKLDQKFCVGTEGWAAEWEHAVLGRNGRTLESDNAFVYRIEDGKIAEMWMFVGAPAGSEAFFA